MDVSQSKQRLDFSYSNLVLMVGGQIVFLVILLMIVFFGTPPVTFPANAVRKMLNQASVVVNVGKNGVGK